MDGEEIRALNSIRMLKNIFLIGHFPHLCITTNKSNCKNRIEKSFFTEMLLSFVDHYMDQDHAFGRTKSIRKHLKRN